jgi:hypothetical protein
MALENRLTPLNQPPALSGSAATLLFRPLVISGMMACIATAWVIVAQLFSPYWQGTYLVLGTTLLTLGTLLSEQLAARVLRPAHRWRVRLAEIMLAALLLRPMMYLQRDSSQLWADAVGWLRQPATFFGDTEYLVGLMVMTGLWFVALDIARVLQNLGDPYTRAEERELELSDLNRRFVGGALFLLGAPAVVQIRLIPRGILLRPVEGGALTWLTLIYLGLGMLLFGQARYALLSAKWQREAIPVASEIGRRWARWGLVFVSSVCLLALLMPAGTTELGILLFLWLSFLAGVVGGLLLFVLQLLLYVLLLPILLLLRSGEVTAPPQPLLPALPSLPPQVSGAFPDWWGYLRLTVFWIAVAGLALWLLRQLVRHWRTVGMWPALWQGLRNWLAGVWRALLGRWNNLGEQIRSLRFADGKPSVTEAQPNTASWWSRWRARTMREHVRRLYLLMLERAQQAGAGRAPHQTPNEYRRHLEPRVSGEEEALQGLTEAFVQARYSQRDFAQEDLQLLRRMFNRLRSRLRRV